MSKEKVIGTITIHYERKWLDIFTTNLEDSYNEYCEFLSNSTLVALTFIDHRNGSKFVVTKPMINNGAFLQFVPQGGKHDEKRPA